jgi:C4-dicarboxylate transporter, DctQ subunit
MRNFSNILRALAWASAFLFICAGCMLTYEVTARYLFVAPTIWAAELSQLCLIWGTMIAMPWLFAANRHIAVDAVIERLGPVAKNACQGFSLIVIGSFSAVVAWKGAEIFYDSFDRGRTTGSMLDMPIWVSELAIPVGFGLLFVQTLIEIRETVRRSTDKDRSVS